MASPGTMSARYPIRSDSAPATTDRHGVAVHGKRRRPVLSGEFPRANWKNWLVRNTAPKVAAVIRNNAPTAAEKVVLRNSGSGIIGSSAPGSRAVKGGRAAESRAPGGAGVRNPRRGAGGSPAHGGGRHPNR